MTIRTFRRFSAPPPVQKKDRERERWRGSRQSRGYDREWDLLAADYKKSVLGRCEECRRRGYLEMGQAVDHIIPIADDPDLRLDRNNLQMLCRRHHHGWKARMEDYARKTGAVRLLQQWCKHPETRPIQFQIMKRGPLASLFDAEDGK